MPPCFDWSLRFLRECTHRRTRANMRQIVTLALYSRRQLQALRAETALAYDHLERGILHIYTDRREFATAIGRRRVMRDFGCERRTVSVDECIAIEPALASARPLLVGGDYTAADESGDAHRFTQQLAARCAARGVVFRYGVTVDKLARAAGRVAGVMAGRRVAPGRCLCRCARQLHAAAAAPARSASAGLSGEGLFGHRAARRGQRRADRQPDRRWHKIVFSRLGQRLRIAGTAEFNGYNTELNPCAAAP
jgi:D-amino-acid dehydrogenase